MFLIMKDSEPFKVMADKELAIDEAMKDAAIEKDDFYVDTYQIIEFEVGQKIDMENLVSLPEPGEDPDSNTY